MLCVGSSTYEVVDRNDLSPGVSSFQTLNCLPHFIQESSDFVLSVKSLGCYKDTGRRAVPQMDGRNPLVTGYYRRRADAIKRCALVALRFGYRVFAVQHQGWCATGPRAHLTYRKYGPTNRCRNGKGGPWANDVYAIKGKCTCRIVKNVSGSNYKKLPHVSLAYMSLYNLTIDPV